MRWELLFMKIDNRRLFTYPVLAEDRSDYKTCEFSCEMKISSDAANNIVLNFNLSTDCAEIKNLISKGDALDTLKNSLPQIFEKYFVETNNLWLTEIFGENPFVKFKEVPNFELTPLDKELAPGEIDLNNCKIIYRNFRFLTPRQAADERFWAGLCHGAFYNYKRTIKPKIPVKNFDDTRKVKLGDMLKVESLDNGRKRNYKISSDFKKRFPDIFEELIGKKINSVVTIRDEKFKITEIG